MEVLTYERISKTQPLTVARDVSWLVKNGDFAFFNAGDAMIGGAGGSSSVSVSVAMLKDSLEERLVVSWPGVRGRDVVWKDA